LFLRCISRLDFSLNLVSAETFVLGTASSAFYPSNVETAVKPRSVFAIITIGLPLSC